MIRMLRFILLFVCSSVFAQTPAPYSVYLVGDAGEYTAPGKALLLLKEQLLANPSSTVIFLGDNVYPKGLNTKDTASVLRLESQLQLLKDYKGRVYFIPGNHDWDAQKRKGMKKLKVQEEYVNNYIRTKTSVENKDAAVFLQRMVCPVPKL
jgi:UDP-2,3-diacylglucosamine pyrophosphatase LpxH